MKLADIKAGDRVEYTRWGSTYIGEVNKVGTFNKRTYSGGRNFHGTMKTFKGARIGGNWYLPQMIVGPAKVKEARDERMANYAIAGEAKAKTISEAFKAAGMNNSTAYFGRNYAGQGDNFPRLQINIASTDADRLIELLDGVKI